MKKIELYEKNIDFIKKEIRNKKYKIVILENEIKEIKKLIKEEKENENS